MNPQEKMERIDALLAHVWMVRTFVKHSEEAEEDEELQEVARELYDFALALGQPWKDQDAAGYLKAARKKLRKLRAACDQLTEIQPEISDHTNFQMAAASLRTAVADIVRLMDEPERPLS